jgi:hypothetical protein
MAINTNSFIDLSKRLTQIDLWGSGPPVPPWGKTPTEAKMKAALDSGAPLLPLVYRNSYVAPLESELHNVFTEMQKEAQQAGAPLSNFIEPYAAVSYEHANDKVGPPLGRFLAVISNLYRSFLDKSKREAAQFPISEQLPPLAFFQNLGNQGPYTIPCDDTHALFGADVGVVSLPSTYRDDPVIWAALAHETGGHDVLHADPDLLPELEQGVRDLFGGTPAPGKKPTDQQFLGLLWSYWMDEAASDVYGLLNIGPTFALNLAAFFAALIARIGIDQGKPMGKFPFLSADSGPDAPNDPRLDVHPTDLLRLHLAIGAVQSLAQLSQSTRNGYISDITAIANLCAQGATEITITGAIAVDRDHWIKVQDFAAPLGQMADAAKRVGEFIATAKLNALGGHSVQEIETWDDSDESTANTIATAMLANHPVVNQGDDAQLLAGATLALLKQPARYAQVTQLLNDALDSSFAGDPIWSKPVRDHVMAISRFSQPVKSRKARGGA